MLKSFVFDKKLNNLKGLLIGAALDLGINASCILLSVLLGDVKLSFDRFEILPLLFILFSVTVQSGAEDVISRLYLYQKIRRRYKDPVVAFVVNSVFFSAIHVLNPGLNVYAILQITIIAILFSFLIYYSNSFWMCVAFHTAWNFCQNFIFGCPNSGIVSQYSIFRLDAASDGLFFDSAFGVEGSAGGCVLVLVACILIFVIGKKKGLSPVDIWADEESRLEAEAAA